jgi:hypothetical protein
MRQGKSGTCPYIQAAGMGTEIVIEEDIATLAADLDRFAEVQRSEVIIERPHQFVFFRVAFCQFRYLFVRAGTRGASGGGTP